jgi:hypothetical protein
MVVNVGILMMKNMLKSFSIHPIVHKEALVKIWPKIT